MSDTHESSEFNRVLSNKDILALAFGAMIGWGWVVLAGDLVLKGGSLGAIAAFVLGGIMVLFVGLTYAELTAAMPKCGGEHVFSHRALGFNASFICTWAIVLGYVSVVAFEAVAFPTVVEYIMPNYKVGYMYTVAGWEVHATWVMVGAVGSIIITALNFVGVKTAAVIQGVVTLLIALVGFAFFGGALFNGDSANMQPLFNHGVKGFFAVLVMTPWLFVGFDVIPQAAEEIDLPYNKIGRTLILSVVMAIAWYIMIIFGVSRAMSGAELSTANLATADAMKAVFFQSDWAAKILIIGGLGGILTSWNSFLVGGSRAIYAMAESGMLPKFLGKLHPKYKTPHNAILLIGVLSTIAPFFGRKMLVWLVDAGGFCVVISYFIVAISFLVLRYKEPNMVRPYMVKSGKLVGGLAILLTFGMMILYLPGGPASLVWPYEWAIVLGWAILGAVFLAWARLSGDEAAASHEYEMKPVLQQD